MKNAVGQRHVPPPTLTQLKHVEGFIDYPGVGKPSILVEGFIDYPGVGKPVEAESVEVPHVSGDNKIPPGHLFQFSDS